MVRSIEFVTLMDGSIVTELIGVLMLGFADEDEEEETLWEDDSDGGKLTVICIDSEIEAHALGDVDIIIVIDID